ncbi:hypothetical protein MTsDn5_21290 [Alteromonas gracilis]
MAFLAHLLKTPNRHADDFGVFNATQTCLSYLILILVVAILGQSQLPENHLSFYL